MTPSPPVTNRAINAVTDCGADNTGQHDATSQIQDAINAAQAMNRDGSNNLIKVAQGAVYLPAGIYLIGNPASGSPTLSIANPGDVTIYGDGVGATSLVWTNTYYQANAFIVAGEKVTIRDMTLATTSFKDTTYISTGAITNNSTDKMDGYTAGAAINYYDGPGNLNIRNMIIFGFPTGIQLDNPNAAQVWIHDVNIDNSLFYGLLVTQLGGNAYFSRLQITGTFGSTMTGSLVGIRINRGDGYQISDSIVGACGKANLMLMPLKEIDYPANVSTTSTPTMPPPGKPGTQANSSTAPTPSTAPTGTYALAPPENHLILINVFCSNTQFDTAYLANSNPPSTTPTYGSAVVVDGLLADPNLISTSYLSWIYFSNCSATSAANNGFFLRNCSSVDITGCKAFLDYAHGVRVDAPSSHVRVNGGQFFNNSQAGNALYDGIYFGPDASGNGTNVSDFAVTGARCNFTTGDFQRFGITVASPNSQRFEISGCNARGYLNQSGNPTFGINDQSLATNKVVHHNPGYNPLGFVTHYSPPTQQNPNVLFGRQPGVQTYPVAQPTVPGSNSPVVNPFGIDATVYLAQAPNMTVQAVFINSTQTGATQSVPSSSSPNPVNLGAFRVPAGATIALLYTNNSGTGNAIPPTWNWFLD